MRAARCAEVSTQEFTPHGKVIDGRSPMIPVAATGECVTAVSVVSTIGAGTLVLSTDGLEVVASV